MTDPLARLQAALGDRYTIERELGRGGMATVYLAHDQKHDRKVAVKVLYPDLAAALGPGRFRREIQIATRLSHPHILPLYDSGDADGQLFYVMPFVEGESLRNRIDREKQLPVDEALKITCEIASALDYAHRHGVVHRDIKPENILLEDGHAIVADFGIARALTSMAEGPALTQTGVTLGTPTYMSPEQSFAEKEIDGRSDLYSLGCVLYEMLIGQPPFLGPNAQAIMARHSMEQVPSLRIVRSTVPDEIEDAVHRALAKSPADRYATVSQFAEELNACLVSGGTMTRRVDRRAVVRKPTPRRAHVIGLAAAGVLLLSGLGWTAWRFLARPTLTAAAATGGGGLDPRRVAVLYFDDLSKGRQLGYVADGLTEALIDELNQVRTLDVVSKNGVGQYRGDDVAPDSIGHGLSAGTIVKGSVEDAGSKLRVAIRLIDGNSGVDLKRKSFEAPKGNVLAVRDRVAREVGDFLRERVGEEVRLREQQEGTQNVAAWTMLQRAQRLRKDADAATAHDDSAAAARSFAMADSLLVQASRLDARWAEPVATRATIAYRQSRIAGDPIPARPWIDRGLALADSALAVNPKSAEALETRGSLRYWKYLLHLAPERREAAALVDSAEQDLKAAVKADPSRANAWSALSHLYARRGDDLQAHDAARAAYDADAYLSAADAVLWRLFTTSYDLVQYQDAERSCNDGQMRFPSNKWFIECQLWLMTMPGVPKPDVAQAWKLIPELKSRTPEKEWRYEERMAQMLIAAILVRGGQPDSARHVLARARAGPDIDPQRNLAVTEAMVRTLLKDAKDKDEAFRLLRMYLSANPEDREPFARSQTWWWNDLREDPRYSELTGSARG